MTPPRHQGSQGRAIGVAFSIWPPACCDVPDIIWPVIEAGLPVRSAVKFDDPSLRTAVTPTRALPPMSCRRTSQSPDNQNCP